MGRTYAPMQGREVRRGAASVNCQRLAVWTARSGLGRLHAQPADARWASVDPQRRSTGAAMATGRRPRSLHATSSPSRPALPAAACARGEQHGPPMRPRPKCACRGQLWGRPEARQVRWPARQPPRRSRACGRVRHTHQALPSAVVRWSADPAAQCVANNVILPTNPP